jgi:uncharacterized protein with PIN domain
MISKFGDEILSYPPASGSPSHASPEKDQPALKLIADANLGRLVTWLRILGYDTESDRGEADRPFLRRARKEGRVVLTRKRGMACRQFVGMIIVILQDRVPRQLDEVIEKLGLHPAPEMFFSRCLRCNLVLEKIGKADAENRVPEYVYQNAADFRRCPQCRRVYWPGTHGENARRFLRRHIPDHRP